MRIDAAFFLALTAVGIVGAGLVLFAMARWEP